MSDLDQSKSIKFPEQHYIGIIGRTDDNLPLGFMTVDGTDKAAQKRKDTVDQWVSSNSLRTHRAAGTGYPAPVSSARAMKNIPLVGFRLGRSIRRNSGWGSGNVKWRMEDPRGFELEISSPNMAQIVDSCVLHNGEILDECVWARLGADNVLVPVSSELYKTTLVNSERQNKSVKPSQVVIGNRIILQNGTEGVYYGKYFEIKRSSGRRVCSDKPRHIIVLDSGSIYEVATLTVAEIVSGDVLDPSTAEKLLCEKKRYWVSAQVDIGSLKTESANPQFVGSFVANLPTGELVAFHIHDWDINHVKYAARYGPRARNIDAVEIRETPWINDKIIDSIEDKFSPFYSSFRRYKTHSVKFTDLPNLTNCVKYFYEIETPLGNTVRIDP